MPDERPKPQYGEYAPEGWVSPNQEPPPPPPLAADIVVEAPKRRTWDTVLTVSLLSLGLYSVLSGYVGFGRLSDVFEQMFSQLGIGEFTSRAAAGTIAIVANVVQTVIWLVVAVLSAVALQRGRIAFWWPLAGGILANLVIVILVGIVLLGDPAYVEYVSRLSP